MRAKEKLLLRQVARELMEGLEEGADVRDLNIPDVEGVSRECIEALFKAASPGGKGVVAHFKEYNFDPDWEHKLSLPSWESVEREAHDRAKSIIRNFSFLGDILDRYESTIHRRWSKKSNKLRRTIILKAWGVNMALSHRPDFEAMEREAEVEIHEGSNYRDSYLWPYINQEDLCNSRSLLLLMSTRSRCHPSELANSEHEAHRLGRCVLAFGLSGEEWRNYAFDLTTQGAESSYGRVWNRQADPIDFAAAESHQCQIGFSGLLVLEAQERVLSFLVECAKLILHDSEEGTILQAPIQHFTDLAKPETGYASLATIAAEAPYQQPGSLDFARIASLLAAKHDHIADHIWSLREDPGYYEAHMLEYMEHRRELLLTSSGRQHPLCSAGKESKIWARVVADQISRAYFRLEVVAELLSQAKALKNMQEEYADEISTSSDFPKTYEAALIRFRLHILEAAGLSSVELCLGFHASPPVRRHHMRRDNTDPDAAIEEVGQRASYKDDPIRDRIYWLLLILWNKDGRVGMIGLNNVVDELHRLIDAGPAKSLISTYLASVVGDLAIFSECHHQVDLYQPPSLRLDGVVTEQRVEQRYDEYHTRWDDMVSSIDERDCGLGTLGGPFDGKFSYPIAKRKTRENVEILRSAERNLDKFWHKVDQDMKSKSGGLRGGAVHRLLTQGRQLQRTPEWVEPVRERFRPPIEELYIPFSQLSFDDKKSNDQSLLESFSEPPKEKIKTRKLGSPKDVAANAEVVIPSAETEIKPVFAIDAKALKVFKTMFFTPSLTSTPGEVAWADFLFAMVSVGFNPQKLYESVWQFSPDPDKLDAERSIQFHEPHGGNSKIPYQIARRHGRRLNRAYGWSGSSFTLEDKLKSKLQ